MFGPSRRPQAHLFQPLILCVHENMKDGSRQNSKNFLTHPLQLSEHAGNRKTDLHQPHHSQLTMPWSHRERPFPHQSLLGHQSTIVSNVPPMPQQLINKDTGYLSVRLCNLNIPK